MENNNKKWKIYNILMTIFAVVLILTTVILSFIPAKSNTVDADTGIHTTTETGIIVPYEGIPQIKFDVSDGYDLSDIGKSTWFTYKATVQSVGNEFYEVQCLEAGRTYRAFLYTSGIVIFETLYDYSGQNKPDGFDDGAVQYSWVGTITIPRQEMYTVGFWNNSEEYYFAPFPSFSTATVDPSTDENPVPYIRFSTRQIIKNLQTNDNVCLKGRVVPLQYFTENWYMSIYSARYYYAYTILEEKFTQIGYADGYADGYDAGYEVGEDVGFEAGQSDDIGGSFFAGALKLVQALFASAVDFFSVPIVGNMNIGTLLIGIPAVFMILNGVVSLVKSLIGYKKE